MQELWECGTVLEEAILCVRGTKVGIGMLGRGGEVRSLLACTRL